MRESLGVLDPNLFAIPVWAKNGDTLPIGDFSAGYDSKYTGSVFPDRRHLNHVLAFTTAVASDVNKSGCGLPWDAGIEYEVGADVLYEGTKYVCILKTQVGQSPIYPLYWSTLSKYLGIDAIKADTEYVPFQSHVAHELSCSVTAIREYSISGFLGGGLDVSEIRGLHIELRCQSREHTRYLTCTLPHGQVVSLLGVSGTNVKDRAHQFGLAYIPVNSETQSVTLDMSGGDSNFKYTIRGATQRKLGV